MMQLLQNLKMLMKSYDPYTMLLVMGVNKRSPRILQICLVTSPQMSKVNGESLFFNKKPP